MRKGLKIIIWLIFATGLALFAWENLRHFRAYDAAGPSITMKQDNIEVSIKDEESAWLAGVTATDSKDGDVTSSLGIERVSAVDEDGSRKVNIVAFDSDNHVAREIRTITYTDYRHPSFRLQSAMCFPVNTNITEITRRVQATDVLDGDITSRVSYSGEAGIDVYTAGDYQVVFEVTNSAGDRQELPLTVTIYNSADRADSPQIELKQPIIYIKKGKKFDPLDQLESVYYRGTNFDVVDGRGTFGTNSTRAAQTGNAGPTVGRSQFKVDGQVDTKTEGVYEVKYTLSNDQGREGSVRLVVVVEKPI